MTVRKGTARSFPKAGVAERLAVYDAFIPEPVVGVDVVLPGDVAGVVSDASSRVSVNRHATGPGRPMGFST